MEIISINFDFINRKICHRMCKDMLLKKCNVNHMLEQSKSYALMLRFYWDCAIEILMRDENAVFNKTSKQWWQKGCAIFWTWCNVVHRIKCLS